MVIRPLRARRTDDGVALVTAIALVGLVGLLVMSVVAVAMYETRATGRDRQRSSAVMTAEGRVDAIVAAIQSADTATLSTVCGDLAEQDVSVIADTLAVDATVTYLDENENQIDCSSIATTKATYALIEATSTSDAIAGTTAARRKMETLLKLEPVYGNDLDKAIFGNAGVTVENHGNIKTADGSLTADVYTNGDFECDGNQEYKGSIQAQGSINLDSPCVVGVDAHARGSVSVDHAQSTVSGRALSSTGSVYIKGHLGQYARAAGTASGPGCVPSSKCVGGQSVPAPVSLDFPQLVWDGATQAEWQDASKGNFTRIETISGAACEAPTSNGDKDDAVGAWIKTHGNNLGGNTVLIADCPGVQVYQSGISLKLSHNLAIWSTAGVKIDGNPVIESTNAAQTRNLYLIQPYGASCNPNPGIYLGNNVEFRNSVNVLLYSPCDVDKRNQADIFGQVYAGGEANLSNKTELWYEPLPVWGIKNTNSTVKYYDVEIMYKRENV